VLSSYDGDVWTELVVLPCPWFLLDGCLAGTAQLRVPPAMFWITKNAVGNQSATNVGVALDDIEGGGDGN